MLNCRKANLTRMLKLELSQTTVFSKGLPNTVISSSQETMDTPLLSNTWRPTDEGEEAISSLRNYSTCGPTSAKINDFGEVIQEDSIARSLEIRDHQMAVSNSSYYSTDLDLNDLSSNYGNFGFGPSMKKSISGKYERFNSKWYDLLDKLGLSFLYESRYLLRIIVFTVIATVAAFIYMISDYQVCVTKFESIGKTGKMKSLRGFPIDAGVDTYEVDLKMTGMFNPNILELNMMTEGALKIEFCDRPWPMIDKARCYGAKHLALVPDGTEAATITWSQILERQPATFVNMQLVNQSKFSWQAEYCFVTMFSEAKVWVALALMMMLYLLLITELMHKTLAAMFISTLSLAALSLMNKGPDLHTIVSWIEWETLFLLFGMMLLVAVFAESGFFDFISVQAYRVSKGDTWNIIFILCAVTAFTSAFLDNVTTILLLTPVTINLCQVLNLEPKWFLIAEVILSNIGGTATAIGDPPNVLIVSSEQLVERGINFPEFTSHLFPGALVAGFGSMALIRLLYTRVSLVGTRDVSDVTFEKELRMWRQTMARVGVVSREEKSVRRALIIHMQHLVQSRRKHENKQKSRSKEVDFKTRLTELEKTYVIRDKVLLAKCCVVLIAVVLMLFLQSTPLFSTELGIVSIMAAILLLLLADIQEIQDILHRVEWDTLIFFACLFVIIQALNEMGLISFLVELSTQLIDSFPSNLQFAVSLFIVLWSSAITSSFIDNIPFTQAMIPVIVDLCDNNSALHLKPLVYALAFGACFGGNGTIIGASANVVCAGIAESKGNKITFKEFFFIGFPVMIFSTLIAMIYLFVSHLLIGWGNV